MSVLVPQTGDDIKGECRVHVPGIWSSDVLKQCHQLSLSCIRTSASHSRCLSLSLFLECATEIEAGRVSEFPRPRKEARA